MVHKFYLQHNISYLPTTSVLLLDLSEIGLNNEYNRSPDTLSGFDQTKSGLDTHTSNIAYLMLMTSHREFGPTVPLY